MNQNEDLKPQVSQQSGNQSITPNRDIPLIYPEVEIENAINLLIVKGYLLAAPDVGILSISGLLNRFYKEKMSNLQQPQTTAVINIKDENSEITIQDFKEKAEIPFRITTNKGKHNQFSYNVGQISRDAEKYFNEKVRNKTVNIERLIQATKAYYKDESVARPTLTNYFINGLWLDVYKHYEIREQRRTTNSLRL